MWYDMDTIALTAANEMEVVERVISLLKRGGVAAVPTDTVYGLLADVLSAPAVRKVFRMKARSHAKAVPVFVRDIPMARMYAHIDAKIWRMLDGLWPGQTTAVLAKKPSMPDLVTGGEKSVGMRVPDYRFLHALLERFPRPLTATSANRSGDEPASSGEAVRAAFRGMVPQPDLVVDAGALPPSPSSTVLDLTNPHNPKVLRMGAVTKEKLAEIFSVWAKKP